MTIADTGLFKLKALHWASTFSTCCYFDSNDNTVYGPPGYGLLIAAGADEILECAPGNAFDQLKEFHRHVPGWLFGFFSYDLKNESERLYSRHPDHVLFPGIMFFRPQIRLEMNGNEVRVFPESKTAEVMAQIENIVLPDTVHPSYQNIPIALKPRFSKDDYIATVKKLHKHIAEGDVYEVTFCQEFYADEIPIQPVEVFRALNEKAKAPFSAFLKHDGRYLLSSSPERYLQKHGDLLTSQPIKGTAGRGKDTQEDEQLKQQLLNDPKERAENVMIVDLVRNDLSRVCIPGTVQVTELFGVKTFEQVHHLVSTITGQMSEGVHFTDAIKNTFPMGSMTGAPKIMAMELIEQYERTQRGLYSGAVGYITPDGDFDLNVVIRSILYNEQSLYLSYQVGSAVTFDSVPEKEYEECLLKAMAMRDVLLSATPIA